MPLGHAGSTSRRALLTASVGLAAAVSGPGLARATPQDPRILAFFGPHQNGIATPAQAHTYFAAFDLNAEHRTQVAELMRAWTDVAARLTQGLPVAETMAADAPPPDGGDTAGLAPARLTITFGFGQSLFSKDGVDRYGLAAYRPAAFVDLPKFPGDQLVVERTGGDLVIQACSDDQQTTLHAVRQLMRLANGVATLRWVQNGFVAGTSQPTTPRNLMGFKDGSFNVAISDPAAMDRHVWVGEEGGAWMRGGTYLVARPTRIALEHWDQMKLAFQEQTVGRHKASGALIGGTDEFAPLDLDANDADGNPLVAENSHVRLAAPQNNDGAEILRRSYSYDNGVAMIAQRWPPWRHALSLDAGLLFVCYQRDPRTGFIKIFEKMSRFDMMNQFVTPIGGGLYACPGGVANGRYLAQDLFEGSGNM
jgi:deferrochelatase/peroxidase EfeB